ncbi:MAG: amidophosphoribosyltransferase [Candidatus Micrarchaeota archaeon]|nr:amidophosphoribosyltransferase [Candidatus Micrarchaeota archaeon]
MREKEYAVHFEAWKSINHRGETSHGLAYLSGDSIISVHEQGLIRDSPIFKQGHPEIKGNILIAHNRYPTSSGNDRENDQPFQYVSPQGTPYALGHNGNIANDGELRALIPGNAGGSDTKVLGELSGKSIDAGKDMPGSIKEVLGNALGSYSLTFLIGGNNPMVVAIRDPLGYMPLSVGENGKGFYVASESIAFNHFNAQNREVNPGEMVIIDRSGMTSHQLFEQEQTQYCMFQWVYILHSTSIFEGTNAYIVRDRLGAKMAERYSPEVDFVMPVPDSGRAAAQGYANARGIPLLEGIMKERYESKRSFIQDEQLDRQGVIKRKLSIIKSVVEGKDILVIDDSLVRGNTAPYLIKMLREAGAREIHMAFACPPIVSQCAYGVDFYNSQLFARQFMNGKIDMNWPDSTFNEHIAQKLGVSSVYYNTIGDLVESIGKSEESLCLSCLTGEYKQDIVLQTQAARRQ